MRLVTWNLNGLEDANIDDRTEAAVFTMILGARLDQLHAGMSAELPPDVIVLQEVTKRMFAASIARHLPAGGYSVIPVEAPDREVFEVMAFRNSVRFVDYNLTPLVSSNYGRLLHTLDLVTETGRGRVVNGGTGVEPEVEQPIRRGAQLRVLTAHFDSGTDGAKIRTAQLRQVAAAVTGSTVFAGDANLRKAEWEAVQADVPMRDAWEVLGRPADTRVTWVRDEYKARFDRVFVGADIRPSAMRAYGRDPLPGSGHLISDHVGLAFDFTLA